MKVYTYKDQPCDNLDAWRLGEACGAAADEPKCGDMIDRGLILLRELQAQGYGIVRITDPTTVCPRCNGSGEDGTEYDAEGRAVGPRLCSWCESTGEVTADQQDATP